MALVINTNHSYSQPVDSLSLQTKSNWASRDIAISAGLIGGGLILLEENRKNDIQDFFRENFGTSESQIDDYLQYAPLAALYIVDFGNGAPGEVWLAHTKNIVISELATLGIVYILKKSLDHERPDGGRFSFPSGHTAQAFLGASLFYHHHYRKHPWLARLMYLPAVATGFYRVWKDRHWAPDVLVGAGMGCLMPWVIKWVGLWSDDNSKGSSQNRQSNVQFGIGSGGISLVYRW